MNPRFELRFAHATPDFALDVSIESDARVLGVFGPSGAGKTTLLELVAGWRTPSRGRTRVGARTWFDSDAGVDVAAHDRRVGYVPQEQLLFPHWTAEENVRSGRRRARSVEAEKSAFRRAVEVLAIGPLLPRGVGQLSGGERQRVALARALCSDPDLLVLDEPFGGIDHQLRRRILPFLLRLRDAFDVPILFVSHDPTEVQALCDGVVLLENGRSVAVGPPTGTLLHRASASPHVDNVLRGTIAESDERGTQLLRLESGVLVRVTRTELAPGAAACLAIAADQVIVATDVPPRTSARNHLVGTLVAVRPLERHVLLEARIDGNAGATTIHVSVSEELVRDLGLVEGRTVHLVFKSTACRLLEADDAARTT